MIHQTVKKNSILTSFSNDQKRQWTGQMFPLKYFFRSEFQWVFNIIGPKGVEIMYFIIVLFWLATLLAHYIMNKFAISFVAILIFTMLSFYVLRSKIYISHGTSLKIKNSIQKSNIKWMCNRQTVMKNRQNVNNN